MIVEVSKHNQWYCKAPSYLPLKTTGKEDTSRKVGVLYLKTAEFPWKKKLIWILPNFRERWKRPHEPSFWKKQTKPPKQFTEATLLGYGNRRQTSWWLKEMRENLWKKTHWKTIYPCQLWIETVFSTQSVIILFRNKKQVLPTQTAASMHQYYSKRLAKILAGI